MKKIFISYSKLDLDYIHELEKHLSALRRDSKIATWYCSELEAGSQWDVEIKKKFDESDLVLFMISPNFMKTDYIFNVEIPEAIKKQKTNPHFRIVPIIIDFCRWKTKENDLSVFTGLPYTLKPIASFKNQNEAWYVIEECLRLAIESSEQPKGDNWYEKQNLPEDVKKIFRRIVNDEADA